MALPRECTPQVLVVEDDSLWARLLITGLEPRCRVDWGRTLGEARGFLEDRLYDLVVTDLQLGLEAGHGVPSLARRFNPNTRVLIVSGHASLARVAAEVAADAWLAKPVRLKDLRAVVDDLLARERRDRPGRVVQTLPWDSAGRSSTHAMALYASDEERLDAASTFVADGLRAGDRAVAIVARGLHERMKALVLAKSGLEDGDRLRADLHLMAAEAVGEQVLKDGLPSRRLFAGLAPGVLGPVGGPGARPVRLYGEGVDLLVRRGLHRAAVQLEALWNEIVPPAGVRMLCGFAQAGLGDAPCGCLRDLTGQHDLCARAV